MSAEPQDDESELEAAPTAFAVRMSEDHQVVGIFVAVDLDDLADLVDQCCDPIATEYLRLGTGGIYVGSRTLAQWPPRWETDDAGELVDVIPDDADPMRGAWLDDLWSRDIDGGDWIPLVWDRELPKRPQTSRRGKGKR